MSTLHGVRLVVGTAPLGGLYEDVPESTAMETLQQAWEHGVRDFDTAPHYGAGLAEERLGTFLSHVDADEARISTKVGRSIVEDADAPVGAFVTNGARRTRFDFSADAVRSQLSDSLRRLRVTQVETAFLHDPDRHREEAVRAAEVLESLREDGVIRRIGVGTGDVASALWLLRRAPIDVVMIAGRLTLLDPSAAAELAPECVEREAELWAAGVLNGGVLAAPRPGAYFDYRPASDDVLRRARMMEDVCAGYGLTLREVAIQAPLRIEGVTGLVVGVRSPRELQEATESVCDRIPHVVWTALDEIRRAPIDSQLESISRQ